MGILTDYFVATPEVAATLADAGPHEADLPKLELKGVDPAVLGSTLWAVIEGVPVVAPYSAPFDLDRYDAIDEWLNDSDDDTHALVQLDDGFVRALATLPDERVAPVAALWGTAEEWGGPVEPGELDGLVLELRDLAREVRSEEQHLYVWWSL
ncbi:hypothetical protein Val02_12780 [Virgisporangium aliadipatigenens]|uniref:Uncharacterized protein n=1 Tax=Virgisporangium aliadipatigenens TaxID=741659 RepID=A0A8J3YHJ2_9ACTN|nr:hypothetical protein [Virgisporangium aliadipatigenens]GIJ44392.1 hypothetical protein Val02_12780 [Virgisporangium aliadipatigenens]